MPPGKDITRLDKTCGYNTPYEEKTAEEQKAHAEQLAAEAQDANLANANRAVYYWDFYCLTRSIDYLAGAVDFMRAYRQGGGEGYKNVEESINGAVAAAIKALT